MTVTAENILYHELVGLATRIDESPDATLRGVSGTIISETRNTITVENGSGRSLQIAKNVATRIRMETGSGVCFISGSSLIGKPEDRLARLHK
jgi:ribonuclease P protein subunit POP4